MIKVTYLLGAGASAEALPLVKSNPDFKIEGLPDAFRRVGDQLVNENKDPDSKDLASKLKEKLFWLAENSEIYNTVDTFAKYCYLKDKERLSLIKKILSVYFTIEQSINKKFDNRYLVFLTSILENEYQFPSNVKILNWNYDCQLQLASFKFKEEGISFDSNSFIQADPLINYSPSLGMYPLEMVKNKEIYSLVHLNGIAGYVQNKENMVFNTLYNTKTISEFLSMSVKQIENNFNLLTFAWESQKHQRFSQSLELSKEIIKGSEVLVIIGYSFPFFNREIDKEIIGTLIQTGLKKIYYQDKFRKGDFLQTQFGLDNTIVIKNIDKTDQLFIPIEL